MLVTRSVAVTKCLTYSGREGLIVGHSSGVEKPWWENVKQLATSPLKSGSRERMHMLSLLSLGMWYRTPGGGMAPSTFRVALSTTINSI